ncbi:hypothetical protein EX895_006242 [Sporisorium graminicola]|uniref:Uncharacterized protein n=1 Tax=Sporisorium graminicola TaxID=280036 RepID=A0A4U7KQ92_9BASI|nr:hypothetical protein EX895_006242 [Sporisorium graminicola]TKY85162.1 hypothetical protein EX895_006242 [Sporisorium graminicola]
MMQRSFSTSATRACWLGDQRVASRVPRLASKPLPIACGPQAMASSHHLVQTNADSSAGTFAAKRSISEAFGLLAGSTASARTGFRHRHASTWSRASTRGFVSTSSAQDLKQDAKDKLVEEGKKFAKEKFNEKLNAEETKQQAKSLSSSTSKILFAALAVAAVAYQFLGGETHAEEARNPSSD